MEKKYKLVDASVEDQKAFRDGLNEVLNKLGLAITQVINKKPVTSKLENGTTETFYVDYPILLIQKKIEEVEAEVIKKDENTTETT